MESSISTPRVGRRFAIHGWVGIGLALIFWAVNWNLPGLRTYWAFFPMWLGYCLAVDAIVLYRTGTSLLTRSWRKYAGLFLISAPAWWIFEAINYRLMNWQYIGAEHFSQGAYAFWATICFSTVIPAVFGTAELVASFGWIQRFRHGPRIPIHGIFPVLFFISGFAMFILMLAWPNIFFPFIWISLYFLIEPINIWRKNRHLGFWVGRGDWRPVAALWVGVLITAFFWEMWNYFSYPKWVYHVAWGGAFHLFEMPLLGYLGYLPFALELFALYHLVMGLFGKKQSQYVVVEQ